MLGESLGDALRTLRESRGLSLADAARRAGVGKATLHHWETGRFRPTGARLAQALDALGAEPRLRSRLIAANDVPFARLELAHTALGAPTDVGLVLRAMRARRGMTQAEVARAVGVTQSAVAKWESGDSVPSAQTVHELGFAMGAAPEETLALASVGEGGSYGVPQDRALAQGEIHRCFGGPPELFEIVSLGWEAEVWRRAARDACWETTLVCLLAYRANRFVLDGRLDEIPPLVQRTLRLARTPERAKMASPAVSAMAFVAAHRGDCPAASTVAAAAWAERLPDSSMRAWMLKTQAHGLAAMGRIEEAMTLVERSSEMEGRFDLQMDGDRDRRLWENLTSARLQIYLKADVPQKAMALTGDARDPRLGPLTFVQVQHANGRPAPEGDMMALEAWASKYWGSFRRKELNRARQTQERLLSRG